MVLSQHHTVADGTPPLVVSAPLHRGLSNHYIVHRQHTYPPLHTLLSSMTVFRDSIHIGSMSPSSKIHLGPSWVMLANSRMMEENSPKSNHESLTNQSHRCPFSSDSLSLLAMTPRRRCKWRRQVRTGFVS